MTPSERQLLILLARSYLATQQDIGSRAEMMRLLERVISPPAPIKRRSRDEDEDEP